MAGKEGEAERSLERERESLFLMGGTRRFRDLLHRPSFLPSQADINYLFPLPLKKSEGGPHSCLEARRDFKKLSTEHTL